MNIFRRAVPGLVLGLTIALAGSAFAQNVNTTGANNKADSCCCTSSGCCSDSCPMMKKDAMKNHAKSSDKTSCCDCCGDSCTMKDAAKTKATVNGTKSDKHESCCCGGSCDMKNMKMKDMKDTKNKPQA